MSSRNDPNHSLEVRATAVALAAGGSPAHAAKQLGLSRQTVSRWVHQTDPAVLSALAAEKRARVVATITDRLEEAATKVMDAIMAAGDDKQAKQAQSLAVAFGIMDDHAGGRRAEGPQSRFGSQSADDLEPALLERKTFYLEHIRRAQVKSGVEPLEPEGQG